MASADFFLKIDGITGDSANPANKGGIDILSFSFGATNTSTASAGGGNGKVTIQDFHFTALVGPHSPQLHRALADGSVEPTAQFLVAKTSTGKVIPFWKYDMAEVLVSSYQAGGSADRGLVVEEVTLNFAKFDFEFISQTP